MSALREANYFYIPVIFLWGSLTSWFRAKRWNILLSAGKQVVTTKVFWANMVGYLGNIILPARAGELVRAAYLGKENDIPVSFVLATGLVERFMDLIALVILGSTSLALSGIVSAQLETALKLMTVVAFAGLIGILSVPYIGNKLIISMPSLPGVQPSAKEKVYEFLKQFLHGVEALHHPSRASMFILFTCLIWVMDGVGVVIIAKTVHMNISMLQSFILLASLGLSSAIPSTPGYVGVYQFVAVVVLSPFEIPKLSALILIVFLQAMNFLTIITWGWAGIARASTFLGKKRVTVS